MGQSGGDGNDAAALADGLGGVHDQVHHHLAQLGGVGRDGGQTLAEMEPEHHLLANADRQQMPHLLHQIL